MKKRIQQVFLTKPHQMRWLLVFATLVCFLHAHADSYTVSVGSSRNIYCTATAPAGYITHAFYSLVDPNDAAYVALYSHSSEQYATITGLQAKSNIKVEVTYAYTYTGAYDHRTHVGHGTYYDYITVSGGTKPTDVKIVEGDVNIFVGETVELNAKLTPSNASTTFVWGTVSSVSTKPYNFDLTYIGGKAKVKANGDGVLYVVCQTANDLFAVCCVTATKSNESPTAITMNDEWVKLEVGKTKTLTYALTPVSASTKITWSSSDERVATVNTSGKVTAVAAGTAIVSAITENGLSAQTSIVVPQRIEHMSLPESVQLTLGFSDQLALAVSPVNAEGSLTWKSSNESVVSVDGNGLVTGRQTGTAEIEAKTSDGVTAKCQVTVVNAKNGLDNHTVFSRINLIKSLNQKVLENNRK